jgi:hypothetical protein
VVLSLRFLVSHHLSASLPVAFVSSTFSTVHLTLVITVPSNNNGLHFAYNEINKWVGCQGTPGQEL